LLVAAAAAVVPEAAFGAFWARRDADRFKAAANMMRMMKGLVFQ
jgi:hypothetical protein